jgi:hypothetical protein
MPDPNEQRATGERLKAALDLADLGRATENLKLLAAAWSQDPDSAKDHPGLADIAAELRRMVDEVLAATSLAIESLLVGPANQSLLEALTSLRDAFAPVAAALTRPMPDPVEALGRWPACEAAFTAAAKAVGHGNPLMPDSQP